MRTRVIPVALLLCLTSPENVAWTRSAQAADSTDNPQAPAEFIVMDTVLRPREKVPPLGANDWRGCGAIEWAANNYVGTPAAAIGPPTCHGAMQI
jgi:hypothetical protein